MAALAGSPWDGFNVGYSLPVSGGFSWRPYATPRIVLCGKWVWRQSNDYEMQQVSQAKAAEVAWTSRVDFLAALNRFGVTPFQYKADEIALAVKSV